MAKKDTDAMLDKLYESADISTGDMLAKGVMSGLEGFTMGKAGEAIGQAGLFNKGVEGSFLDKLKDIQFDPTSILGDNQADFMTILSMLANELGEK